MKEIFHPSSKFTKSYFSFGKFKLVNIEISCVGASDRFIATTDLDTRTIEVSVNDGDWVDIFTLPPELILQYSPANHAGAELKIQIADGITTARVQMRCSSDIGLYVNTNQGFDEVHQQNQAYTLYNVNGDIVDPSLEVNKEYNSPMADDTSTEEDYVVRFRSAHFCLVAAAPPLIISCDGASDSTTFPELSGVWDIELDGDYYDATEREIVQWLQSSFDSTFNTQQIGSAVTIKNIDTGSHRFRLVPVHSTSFQAPANNITFIEHENGSLTFCLNSKPLISCAGATNSAVFTDNPDFTAWGSIGSIIINEIEYAKPEGFPSGELVPEIITPSGDQIKVSVGGVHPNRTLIFENLGTRPARVFLNVLSGEQYEPSILVQGPDPSNTNPTIEILEGVSFCLSMSN